MKLTRFSDIPKMTRTGRNESAYDLKGFVRTIEKYIHEDELNLYPDFQRGLVWTEEQQIAYVEFLLRGGKTGTVVYLNHPGWMTDFNPGTVGFTCVEGVQRITALSRFCHNDLPVFGSFLSEFEDRIPASVWLYININNLQTRKEVMQWYVDMNSGAVAHTPEEIVRVRKLIELEN